MSKTLLTDIPDHVVVSARLIASSAGETLVGYRAITEPDGPGRVKPARWMIVTNAGVYEVDPDGTCQRASSLHPMPTHTIKVGDTVGYTGATP